MIDTAQWCGKERLRFYESIRGSYEYCGAKIDGVKINGKITGAMAPIILTGVQGSLGMAVAQKQAAQHGLANLIPLAEQTVDVAAEKQAEYLPKQHAKHKVRQLFSYFDN
jgi:hypothetical protein